MNGKKALVVSGGGAKGAWAVGVLRHLMNDRGEKFDIVVGTSTGALMAPFAALGEIGELRGIYTSVRNEDILQYRLGRGLGSNAFAALLTARSGVFGTGPLRRSIERTLTEERWRKLTSGPAEAWVSVVSLQTGTIDYYGTKQPGMTRDLFCSAMRASASIPVFMPPVGLDDKSGQQFVDGGVKDIVPLGHAIRQGASEVTVIILGPESPPAYRQFPYLPDILLRTIDLQMEETAANDIAFGELVTRELLWRDRLRKSLKDAGVAEPTVDDAIRRASDPDNPMRRDDRDYQVVKFKVIRPRAEIGPTLEFGPDRMTRYEEQGHAFAADPTNWQETTT